MPDNGSSLTDLLTRLQFVLSEEIDFSRTDTEATITKVRLLTAAATYFNVLAVGTFGGRLGPAREPGLPEQVVAAAFQTYADQDPHPGDFDKAAMLLRGITQGHPFNDGNKRTGFLVAGFYLRRCGYPLPRPFPDKAVVDLCMRVSAGQVRDVDEIARELQELWEASGQQEGGTR